jgi:hypothetical protein
MPARKFSPGQVRAIRSKARHLTQFLLNFDITTQEYKKEMGKLARKYLLTPSHLSKILKFKIYKDLSDD